MEGVASTYLTMSLYREDEVREVTHLLGMDCFHVLQPRSESGQGYRKRPHHLAACALGGELRQTGAQSTNLFYGVRDASPPTFRVYSEPLA